MKKFVFACKEQGFACKYLQTINKLATSSCCERQMLTLTFMQCILLRTSAQILVSWKSTWILLLTPM